MLRAMNYGIIIELEMHPKVSFKIGFALHLTSPAMQAPKR